MMFAHFPIIASFLAGIATFISPCVFPMIPAYISFITGASLADLKGGKVPLRHSLVNAVLFILGFGVVFTLLGLSASYLGNILMRHRDLIRQIGGVIVIVFGLHLTGLLKIKMLYMERRIQLQETPAGFAGSFLIGVAFAVGWTPCVGPILSSILILASAQETVMQGTLLLIVYSLGLGVPFLLTSLFINWALRFFVKVKQYYHAIEIVSGVILISIGLLLLTNSLQRVSGRIQSLFM